MAFAARVLAEHLAITILAVMVCDILAVVRQAGEPTVSEVIRHSWMRWPVGIMTGLLVVYHFVNSR
jgi:hypothetical protein